MGLFGNEKDADRDEVFELRRAFAWVLEAVARVGEILQRQNAFPRVSSTHDGRPLKPGDT